MQNPRSCRFLYSKTTKNKNGGIGVAGNKKRYLADGVACARLTESERKREIRCE